MKKNDKERNGTATNLLTRAFRHFCLISKHKALVFGYCLYAGIPWRGFMHDWSKYSPTEFWESARYYSGDRSPIVNCREANGYSLAWLHHKGRNPHHYEYWLDYLDEKGTPIAPPFPFALEMVCDMISASRAYNRENFTYRGALEWWRRRCEAIPPNMRPETKRFVDAMLEAFAAEESCRPLRRAKEFFEAARRETKR